MTRLLTVFLLLASPTTARAAELDELIDRVVDAYGGREALQAVERFEVHGDIVASARGMKGTFLRKVEADGDLATIMSYPGHTEGRLVVGGQGWRTMGDQLEPVSAPLREAISLQWARLRLPLVLDAHREQAQAQHPRVIDGVSYPAVSVPVGDGATLTVWLDPETGLAHASQGVMSVAGHQMSFSAMYRDYRAVDGIMVAHLEQTYAQGVPTATLVVRSVDWSPQGGELVAPEP